MQKSKKAALMLAVLGLGCTYPLADTLVGGTFDFVGRAEAANHPTIYVGDYAYDSGGDNNYTEYEPIYVTWDDRYNQYRAIGVGSNPYEGVKAAANGIANLLNSGIVGGAKIEDILNSPEFQAELSKGANASLSNLTNEGKKAIKDTVAGSISAAETRAKQDATDKVNAVQSAAATDAANKANKAESNAKSYTDEVATGKADTSLDNLSETGKNVIKELAKEMNKDTGIKSDNGNQVVIEKEFHTKETATFEKGVNVSGDTSIGGNTVIQGDTHVNKNVTVDGTTNTTNLNVTEGATINGDTVVKGETTTDSINVTKGANIGGNTTINGDTVVNKNMTVNGTTTTNTMNVTNNANINGNTTIGGNTVVGGSVTANSFKIGDKTYITETGLDANGQNVVNVAAAVRDMDATNLKQVKEMISKAVGEGSEANGKGATATGANAKANGEGATATGTRADAEGNGATATGADAKATANKATANGAHAEASGEGSSAFGADSKASGEHSTANGSHAKATGANATANGYNANASGTNATAIGTNSQAIGNKSTAIGTNSIAIGANSVALGEGSVADEANVVSIGRPGAERRITNVADGINSHDAVNMGQFRSMSNTLKSNINEVAAGAAAMANLHPLEYNENDKVSVSAAVGSYKSQQALALGAFYRPDRKTIVSISGSLGSNDNMFGVGVSKRLGQVSEIEGMTEDQLRDKVSELNDSNKALKADNEALKAKDAAFEKKFAEMTAKMDALSAKLASMESPTK